MIISMGSTLMYFMVYAKNFEDNLIKNCVDTGKDRICGKKET